MPWQVKICDFGLSRLKSELMTGTMQLLGQFPKVVTVSQTWECLPKPWWWTMGYWMIVTCHIDGFINPFDGFRHPITQFVYFFGRDILSIDSIGVINSFRGQQLSQQILDAIGASWKRPGATGNRFAVHEFLPKVVRKLRMWYMNEQGLNFGFWKDNLIQVICTVHVDNLVIFGPRPGIKTWDVQQCPKNSSLFAVSDGSTVFSGDWCIPLHSMDEYGWYLFVSDQPINRSQWLTGAIRYGVLESDLHRSPIDPASGLPGPPATWLLKSSAMPSTLWPGVEMGKPWITPRKSYGFYMFLSSPWDTPDQHGSTRCAKKTLSFFGDLGKPSLAMGFRFLKMFRFWFLGDLVLNVWNLIRPYLTHLPSGKLT